MLDNFVTKDEELVRFQQNDEKIYEDEENDVSVEKWFF